MPKIRNVVEGFELRQKLSIERLFCDHLATGAPEEMKQIKITAVTEMKIGERRVEENSG